MKIQIACVLILLSTMGHVADVVAESASTLVPISSEKQEAKKNEAEKYYQLGVSAYEKEDYDQAVKLYNQALGMVPQNDILRAKILNSLAMFNIKFTNNYEAADQLREVLKISRSNGNSHMTAEFQINFGNVLGLLSQYETAEKELLAGISELHRLGDKDNEATGYVYLAQMAENKEDKSAARKWYLKAAKLYREEGDINRANEMSLAANISKGVKIEK